jgi:hypothetical protein
MEKFNTIVNDNLSWVHSNKIIFSLISLILAIYFIQARPKLPTYVEKVFENVFFRYVVIAFIIYQANKDFQLSLMISAAFLITMHMINKQSVENYGNGGAGGLFTQRQPKDGIKGIPPNQIIINLPPTN